MDAQTSFSEDIHFLPEKPAPIPVDRPRRHIGRWVAALGIGGLATILIGAGIVDAVRESRREKCDANLKRLGLAFHDYHEAHGHFPAPALADSDGKPLLSWRVALLPHLGYRSLYERFRLNEPWDSLHNRSLLRELPPELACPGAGRRNGQTGYLVVVGPEIDPWSVNTAFDATRGVDLREITDGTSNTVLVVEANVLIPWTKPDDLHWYPGGPLPHLKSPHTGVTRLSPMGQPGSSSPR